MTLLHLGKHRGRSFAEVTRTDRPYCAWILRAKPALFKRFNKYLRNKHGGILEVGKHKGMFFDEVFGMEPEYCVWVVTVTL